MQTNVVPVNKDLKKTSSPGLRLQVTMRETDLMKRLSMPVLSNRLSWTLKKNASIGMKHSNQLLQEALCQTLWRWFESLQTTYITFNDAITEWDTHALTEAWWHIDRLLSVHPFPEDVFETKYINIQDEHGNIIRQWVWVVVKETSVQWVRKWHMIFSILAEYDSHNKKRNSCQNPF